jgi:hypothetical protein
MRREGDMSTESDAKAEAQARIAAMDEPRRGQVYRHYKGGLYSVVSVSIDEATLEVLVTYSSNLEGGDTTRTLRNFTETVRVVVEHERDGASSYEHDVPRFRRERS